jgi:hypothetical protein
MSRHFSDDVLLEMAETGKSHPHLTQCSRCRQQIEEARDALHLAREVSVPEPSPLFWDHLSSRVHDAIEREVSHGREGAWTRFARVAWRPAVAVPLVIILVVAVVWRMGPALREPTARSASVQQTDVQPITTSPAATDSQADADLLAPPSDPSWAVITEVTAGLEIETAVEAGIVLQPGASDRAIAQLSPSEQHELVRLLQTDLDGPSS